jgi:hypothetical protein
MVNLKELHDAINAAEVEPNVGNLQQVKELFIVRKFM